MNSERVAFPLAGPGGQVAVLEVRGEAFILQDA